MQMQQITLDVLKPVGTIVNLSDSFNVRVGDRMTPVQMFITQGGLAKDLTGFHPELEATVGNGAMRGNEVSMAAGAKPVHWVGSTSNVTGYNQLTLAFPAEVFPQSGFCYGHLLLINAAGERDSSVDIWFKVLDGVANMGLLAKYYDSELELELAKAKAKNEQFSEEMRKTYNLQVINAQNALTKATANLNELATTTGEINAQIKAQDLITRAEYNDLATKINTTLSGFELHPENFVSEAELKSKYPKGAEGLKITVDTMHKWLYINGAWTDEGPFTFNDLSPKEEAVMYSQSSDNVLINPDLQNGAYGWNKTSDWDMDPAHSIGNSMAYGVNLSDNVSSFSQENINVKGQHFASAGIQVLTVGVTAGINFQLLFKDANGNVIDDAVYNMPIPSDTANSFKLVSVEDVVVPKLAVTAAVTVAGKGKGLLIVCRPQLNCTSKLVPYSTLEVDQTKDQGSDNILINADLKRDAYGWKMSGPWQADQSHAIGNSMAYGLNLTENQNSACSFYQENVNVKGRLLASAGVHVLTVNTTGAQFQLLFKDKNGNIIDGSVYNVALPADTDNHFHIVKIEGVKVPDNAATAALTVSAKNKGLLIICRPQLNCQATLVPYSTQEVDEVAQTYRQSSDNVLVNPDLKHYAYGWKMSGPWQADQSHAIGNSIAYGLYLTDKPSSACSFYQENIDVEKRTVASTGVRVLTVNATGASFQLLFKDKKGQIITTDVYNQSLPSDTANTFQTVSFVNIKVPDSAKTAAITVATPNTGLIIICRPQLNFSDHLIPYSFSDVETGKVSHILPYFDFKVDVSGIKDDWVKTSFIYTNNDRKINGYAQIAIQGDSSKLYPKKNYKIKLFSDADCKNKLRLRLKPSWPATNKFNLKANWIDATQSRNLASAKLIADATAITPFADKEVENHLAKTSNFGQMEGFPIEVYLNGAYNGLYTCNTKKDDKVLGLDADVAGNAAIAVLDNVAQSDTQLLNIPTAKLDNIAYDDELHDTSDPELVANWSKWLDFLNTSTDDAFKAELASYIDVKSAINLYLFGVLSREYDYNTKSVLYLTWNNGKYFYLIPYDLDSNWGQSANGQIEGNPTNDTNWGFATENSTKADGKFVSNANWNKLFERLYKLFMPEIKEQYTYLRSNVWRTDQLLNAYRDFMNSIPEEAYEKDRALWKQIPSQSTNNYEQLHQVIVQRSNQMDRWIKSKQ